MKWIMIGWVMLAALAGTGFSDTDNLLPNGDFEQGKDTPDGWQPIDGLTSFWVTSDDPGHGKVMKFDSSVLQPQAYEWWEKISRGSRSKDAPEKIPFRGEGYDTLAGLDGVWFYSDSVPIEPGKSYWLTVDVKGGEMLLWLQGYSEKPSTNFGAEAGAFQGWLGDKAGTRDPKRGHQMFIHPNDWKAQLKVGGANEWKTYARREKPFRPTAQTPQVRYVRVLLLPLWPPATYYVDNLRLTEFREP